MEGYQRYRIENQAKQILNYADNLNLDKDNLFDVIRIYNKILSNTSDTFSKSLMTSAKLLKSQYLEEYDKCINCGVCLENNNSDSFLIFPMISGNHAFYGVLRKIDNEYSYTIVNRGDRRFHQKYEEYIISDVKEFVKFLKQVSVQTNKYTEEIYQDVLALSKNNKVNLIRVNSIAQKVGNCFIKELESAIKYAYFTRNENKNNIDLVKLRERECIVHKPKWDISNLDMHGKYIDELKKERLDLKETLENIYRVYAINKRARKDKKILSLKNVINKIFLDSDVALEEFLKNVDIDNFKSLSNQIEGIMIDRLMVKYKKLKIAVARLDTKNTVTLVTNEDFLEFAESFTNMSNQLKEEYANMYFSEACKLKDIADFEKRYQLVDKALSLVPFISKAYVLRAKMNEGNMQFIEQAIRDCNNAILMESSVSSNYIEKAKLLELAGRYDEYEVTLLQILKLGKLTKDMSRNAADIFELKGDLTKALKWIQVAISIDSQDRRLKEKEITLMYRIESIFDTKMKIAMAKKKAMHNKCDPCELKPEKIERNSRERGRGM